MLLVEDDVEMLALVTALERKGIKVQVAENGQQEIEVPRNAPILPLPISYGYS